MHTDSPDKPKKLKLTSSRNLIDVNYFLGQERSADGGIHTTRDHKNKRREMLTYGVVLLCDNSRPHTAASTRELLEHFSWELFDYPPYSPVLAPSDYLLVTYLKTGCDHSASAMMRNRCRVSKRG
jgi:hypothetical protein